MTFLSFIVRHFFAVIAALVVGCAAWTVAYLVLLVWAVVTKSELGGPLAYPGGLLLVAVICLVVGWGIFAPACGLGQVVCHEFGWSRFAAIPFVFVGALGLSWGWHYLFIENLTTHLMPPFSTVFQGFVVYLSVPLGAYWWLVDGPVAAVDMIRRLLGKWRIRE